MDWGGELASGKKAIFKQLNGSKAWIKQAGPEQMSHRVAPHDGIQQKQQAIFFPAENIRII